MEQTNNTLDRLLKLRRENFLLANGFDGPKKFWEAEASFFASLAALAGVDPHNAFADPSSVDGDTPSAKLLRAELGNLSVNHRASVAMELHRLDRS